MELTEQKAELRKKILIRLREQSKLERSKRSKQLQKKLFRLPAFIRARSVMFYVSRPEEVETRRMIDDALAMGKKVLVPCIKGNDIVASRITDRRRDLKRGKFGIYEPRRFNIHALRKQAPDCIIVPGLAFDGRGRRLGRGRGYYDRFLKNIPKASATIALAFRCQRVREVPAGPRDIPIHKLIVA